MFPRYYCTREKLVFWSYYAKIIDAISRKIPKNSFMMAGVTAKRFLRLAKKVMSPIIAKMTAEKIKDNSVQGLEKNTLPLVVHSSGSVTNI